MNNFLDSLFGIEKKRHKLRVVLVVFIHILGWGLFFLLSLLFYPVRFDNNNFWIRELASKLFPIGLFYLNYYFLLPRYFEKRKFPAYFSLVFIAIVIVLAQDIVIKNSFVKNRRFFRAVAFETPPKGAVKTDFFIFRSDSAIINFPPLPFREPTIFNIPRGILFMSLNRAGSLCILLILLGGMIRLGFSFIKNQNEKKLLENANLNAEINFLKSQINPHFLFNTLNGIYSLAHNQSKQTEIAILKLSDLMRYVLYESGTQKVELVKDIQYLTNYIDLQRLRLSSKVTIHYKVKGYLDGYYIAPLLLISFIENAFKHGISYTKSSFIQIEIIVFEETLTLFIENPIIETNSFAGGLGLKNVTRRLALLYPGKHSLNIVNNGHLHIVNLKLNLK
jgi:two-component system, LytTR family, sensor kinase